MNALFLRRAAARTPNPEDDTQALSDVETTNEVEGGFDEGDPVRLS